MTQSPDSPTVAPLWVTLRGATPRALVAWAGWLALTALWVAGTIDLLGPAGATVGILTVGWFLARRLPSPVDCLRRYHLDDVEVMAIGPWRRVQRITWVQVERVTQERHALVLAGAGRVVSLPLRSLLETSAWGPVLARVVPALASELWDRIDGGAVRLQPHADPPALSLLWWAYVPALLGAGLVQSPAACATVAAVAVLERAGAWLVGRARACVLQPAGIDVRGRRGRVFVPWAHALVTPATDGLGIGVPGHEPGFVPTAAPSFWAAAAVIELRAQLGPAYAGDVNFRVLFENGGISVVGEVESLH